jgi:hypothetical protein
MTEIIKCVHQNCQCVGVVLPILHTILRLVRTSPTNPSSLTAMAFLRADMTDTDKKHATDIPSSVAVNRVKRVRLDSDDLTVPSTIPPRNWRSSQLLALKQSPRLESPIMRATLAMEDFRASEMEVE